MHLIILTSANSRSGGAGHALYLAQGMTLLPIGSRRMGAVPEATALPQGKGLLP